METSDTCTICYEENNPSNALVCCDSEKKICDDCLNCLRTPFCPYCRSDLTPGMLSKNNFIHSDPTPTTNWASMLYDELLIDPYDPEFRDSRILRRQIRRLRRRFISEQNRNYTNTNRPSARTRRAERKRERRLLRNSVRINNNNLQFELDL